MLSGTQGPDSEEAAGAWIGWIGGRSRRWPIARCRTTAGADRDHEAAAEAIFHLMVRSARWQGGGADKLHSDVPEK